MIALLLWSCNQNPCEKALEPEAGLIDIFQRLEQHKCMHSSDLGTLRRRMMIYHRETTLHCDYIYRRSSMDGWKFDGKEELFLKHASVPDVWIEPDGKHIVVFNDVETEKLASTAELEPERLWQQGLIGYGGLGLAIDEFDSTLVEKIEIDLNLPTPMEVVDPDIGRDGRGDWRIVWFGVSPSQMNPNAHGPLNAPKPHHFYRTSSPSLRTFPAPTAVVKSREGKTGGADPAMLTLRDGSEILYVGPLDMTTMAWKSVDGEKWNTIGPPDFNTRMRFATPDAVLDPEGGYRLYGMLNGSPGRFVVSKSQDGIRWDKSQEVLYAPGAFNISVAVDPVGTWWAYYNRTDEACLRKWGSKKVLPNQPSRKAEKKIRDRSGS